MILVVLAGSMNESRNLEESQGNPRGIASYEPETLPSTPSRYRQLFRGFSPCGILNPGMTGVLFYVVGVRADSRPYGPHGYHHAFLRETNASMVPGASLDKI